MILVTGGAGFIGSNLAAALAEDGIPVAICDRLRTGSKWRNISKLELRDLVAPEQLEIWLEDHGSALDTIVHMGAISSTTETDADLIVATNFKLSQMLWRWCARHGKRFLYASSAATYGGAESGFEDDWSLASLAQLRPLNAYGWSKLLFDRWAVREVVAGKSQPAQWVGLKFFNVYGPNEYHKGGMQSVVAQKYASAAAGETITLFRSHRAGVSDGGQQRDFIYVSDCVQVMLWLLATPKVNGIFNLGTGKARSFAELASALYGAVGNSLRLTYIDTPVEIRPNYQYFTEARMDRLRALGYSRPFMSLEDGVRDYVRRFLSQPDRYR
ncbi:MAG TPA: ADP-glyceromanno-heptose 6-epimerase [Steroidobacteraceae bacterium]|jgi:ADP-L-glycero-D-manno-heptose 6-epimerase|nr:ADP-glyceromanno-heptose 6-epimerase [Steroidobacteraceae bacterium]